MTLLSRLNPFHTHPAGLKLLFFVEMWERFSYYGMRAILVLYLTSSIEGPNPGRGFSEQAATSLYGWYTGLAYFFPLIGGLLADKFLGLHRSLVLGGILISIGHIFLGISGLGALGHDAAGLFIFVSGLFLITFGTGHFKPCVSVMVGELYPKDDARRESAFTLYYMGINLGAFLCVFVCGTLGEVFGWHFGFGAAALGMIGGLIHYLRKRASLITLTHAPQRTLPFSLFTLGIIEITAALSFSAFIAHLLPSLHEVTAGISIPPLLLTVIILVSGVTIVSWFYTFTAHERHAITSILILIFFNVIFWFAFEQAGSSLTLFARDDTDRMLLGYEIPTSWFQAINPFLIILLAPLFAKLWLTLEHKRRDFSQPGKASIGLFLLGLGFLWTIAASFRGEGEKAAIHWLVFTYLFHTVGELFISPTGLNFVTTKAPQRAVSFLMGCWFLSSFFANLLGGIFAGTMHQFEEGTIQIPWKNIIPLTGQGDFFFVLCAISILGALLLAALTPLLRREKEKRPYGV